MAVWHGSERRVEELGLQLADARREIAQLEQTQDALVAENELLRERIYSLQANPASVTARLLDQRKRLRQMVSDLSVQVGLAISSEFGSGSYYALSGSSFTNSNYTISSSVSGPTIVTVNYASSGFNTSVAQNMLAEASLLLLDTVPDSELGAKDG